MLHLHFQKMGGDIEKADDDAIKSKSRDWLKTNVDRLFAECAAPLSKSVFERMRRIVKTDLDRFLFLQQNNRQVCYYSWPKIYPRTPSPALSPAISHCLSPPYQDILERRPYTTTDLVARSTSLSTDCILKGVLATAAQHPSPLSDVDTPHLRQYNTNGGCCGGCCGG